MGSKKHYLIICRQCFFLFHININFLRLPFRVSKSHHNNAHYEHAVAKGNGAFSCGQTGDKGSDAHNDCAQYSRQFMNCHDNHPLLSLTTLGLTIYVMTAYSRAPITIPFSEASPNGMNFTHTNATAHVIHGTRFHFLKVALL